MQEGFVTARTHRPKTLRPTRVWACCMQATWSAEEAKNLPTGMQTPFLSSEPSPSFGSNTGSSDMVYVAGGGDSQRWERRWRSNTTLRALAYLQADSTRCGRRCVRWAVRAGVWRVGLRAAQASPRSRPDTTTAAVRRSIGLRSGSPKCKASPTATLAGSRRAPAPPGEHKA